MTDDRTLWATLHKHMPRRVWISIAEIFTIVQRRVLLDAEDMDCTASRSHTPRWKSNVRRVLRFKQKEGTLTGRKRPS
jgi:hypothetical protein